MIVRYKAIILIFFMLSFGLFGCLENLFYYPDNILYDSPKRLGLKYEEITFNSSDGTKLSGWFIPARGFKKSKGTVIHFHGNAQNMSAHWQFVEWLPDSGYNLFVFDYRGYGKSEGKPNPKGVFEDSNSAVNYVRSRKDIDPAKLIVFGQSLGGANAIAVVGSGNKSGVVAVAIEATFYSYSAIANDKFSFSGSLLYDTYSPDRYIAEISPIPFLLIHGTADAVIPYHHSTQLMAKAKEPKKLITVNGGQHIDSLTSRFSDTYKNMLLKFFEESLLKSQEKKK